MSSALGPRARSNSHLFFMDYFWSVCSWCCYHHNLLFIECHLFMWGCVEHTPDKVFPQGNGNEIQMVMIHDITIKLLRVCEHGLPWDRPWKDQSKEIFDRRGRRESCLALKEKIRFRYGEHREGQQQKEWKGGGRKRAHQDGSATGKEYRGEKQDEDTGPSAGSCVRDCNLLPGAVCPGVDRKDTSCLIKGSVSLRLPRPG